MMLWTPSAAPAMQNDAEMVRVLHLPRKMRLRCTECCSCTQKQPASIVLNHRRTFADVSRGAPSAAPATHNETEVIQVLHLPRKSSRRPYCTCHAKAAGVHSICKMTLRCSKCCTCHAKAACVHSIQSSPDFRRPRPAAPATQMRLRCCTCHAK